MVVTQALGRYAVREQEDARIFDAAGRQYIVSRTHTSAPAVERTDGGLGHGTRVVGGTQLHDIGVQEHGDIWGLGERVAVGLAEGDRAAREDEIDHCLGIEVERRAWRRPLEGTRAERT